jgi:hypothetical protein
MAGVGDDSEANIVEDSNDIEETDAFAASYYQERKNLENSHIAIDDEENWEEETVHFGPVLPSLDNPKAVLEWIYAELKDVCSMDEILKALQSIMRGGEDAEDSNIVVSHCEDDQEDSHSKANPASADGKSCFLSIIDSEGPGSSSSATVSQMYTSEYSSAAADAAAEAAQLKLYEYLPEEASSSSSSAATKFYEASSSSTTFKASSSFYEVESRTTLKASSSSSSSSSSAVAATKFYEVKLSTTLKVSSSFELEISKFMLLKRKLRLYIWQLSAEMNKAWGSRTSIKPSSWSSLTPLTTKQEARIYKDMGGEDQIHNQIFEYIHEDLRWLIWKHPVSALKISRPNRYPLSLFF